MADCMEVGEGVGGTTLLCDRQKDHDGDHHCPLTGATWGREATAHTLVLDPSPDGGFVRLHCRCGWKHSFIAPISFQTVGYEATRHMQEVRNA